MTARVRSKRCSGCGQPVIVGERPASMDGSAYRHAQGCPVEKRGLEGYAVIPRVYVVEYHDGRGWRPTFITPRLNRHEADADRVRVRHMNPATAYRVRRYEPPPLSP